MNVEIGAEAAQFPEKEYINGIAVAVRDGTFEEDFYMLQAMEFPAITLVIFCLLKSGRRITLMIFYTLGGIRDS